MINSRTTTQFLFPNGQVSHSAVRYKTTKARKPKSVLKQIKMRRLAAGRNEVLAGAVSGRHYIISTFCPDLLSIKFVR